MAINLIKLIIEKVKIRIEKLKLSFIAQSIHRYNGIETAQNLFDIHVDDGIEK